VESDGGLALVSGKDVELQAERGRSDWGLDPMEEASVIRRLLAVERRMAQVHQSYASELFFGDVEAPTSGPFWAIDVDGVLETTWLPFPATGPAGAGWNKGRPY